MLTLSINELTTYRWTFDEDVYYARRAGFDAIGVWRRKLTEFGIGRATELLHESGLEVSCLGWAGGFTGSDGRTLDESIRDGLAAVREAAQIGAACLIVYAGGRNHHIDSHADRLLRGGLDDLLMAAEIEGVTLALKPMHARCAEEWTYQIDIEATLRLVDEYRSPHLKLVFDNYHFPHVIDSPTLLADMAPHLALVQLADAKRPHSIELERCPLGDGRMRVRDAVQALLQAGYRGAVDVELMGSEIETCSYEQLVLQTRRRLKQFSQVVCTAPAPRCVVEDNLRRVGARPVWQATRG